MAEASDQILRQIESRRAALANDIDALQDRITREIDWRTQFHRRPWQFLGGALLAGMLVSLIVPKAE
jgi:hypothetical protein